MMSDATENLEIPAIKVSKASRMFTLMYLLDEELTELLTEFKQTRQDQEYERVVHEVLDVFARHQANVLQAIRVLIDVIYSGIGSTVSEAVRRTVQERIAARRQTTEPKGDGGR